MALSYSFLLTTHVLNGCSTSFVPTDCSQRFGMTTVQLSDQSKYYQLSLHRQYSPEDLEEFELFELHAPSEAGLLSVERISDGTLSVPAIGFPDDLETDDWDFMGDAALGEWHIVPDCVRDILAAAQFAHQVLLPVEAEVPPNPQKGVRSYWELTSDFVLPPVSPSMVRLDDNCKRVWPGRPTGGQRIEGLYNRAELHYRGSDLRTLEPLDVARTFESFWGPDNNQRRPDYCPLVVSKRFYNLCRDHGFKIDWVPVHIDPI